MLHTHQEVSRVATKDLDAQIIVAPDLRNNPRQFDIAVGGINQISSHQYDASKAGHLLSFDSHWVSTCQDWPVVGLLQV